MILPPGETKISSTNPLRCDLPACTPPFWARGGHLQTLLGNYIPSPPLSVSGERVSISVPRSTGSSSGARDVLIAHEYKPSRTSPGGDFVFYVFHGLGGESHRPYMRRTAQIALDLGATVILVNHRGCGEGRGLASEPYHSGRAEDLSAVIAWGRERSPHARHIAIGFSLSANALLLLAAGQRADVPPDAAIAVNAPINLARSALLLTQGLNRLYDFSFVDNMREALGSRFEAGHLESVPKLSLFTTLRDFDEIYTAPAGGFKSREHYYETCSAKPFIKDIRIPTFILTAADDPFIDPLDYREVQSSVPAFVQIHIEDHGGHLGYLSRAGSTLGSRRWLDDALREYAKTLINRLL